MNTIKEHNKIRGLQIGTAEPVNKGASVICDDCRVEMEYTDPDVILACIPPKKTVKCPQCGAVNYKTV